MAATRLDAVHGRMVGRIRATADERGIALSHLPDHAGVARSHFWNVMARRKSPTLAWLVKIAKALEVDVSHLLER